MIFRTNKIRPTLTSFSRSKSSVHGFRLECCVFATDTVPGTMTITLKMPSYKAGRFLDVPFTHSFLVILLYSALLDHLNGTSLGEWINVWTGRHTEPITVRLGYSAHLYHSHIIPAEPHEQYLQEYMNISECPLCENPVFLHGI